MTHKIELLIAFLALITVTSYAQENDIEKANKAIVEFEKADPSIEKCFIDAFGYAVIPSIGKGAIGVGGAAGKGTLYKHGKPEADVNMKQVTVGLQFGGQKYSEVIFFEDEATYNRFVEKDYEFAAQVSAVALATGVSKDAPYVDGVKIFTLAKGGLMYEAAIGGQKFKVREFGNR